MMPPTRRRHTLAAIALVLAGLVSGCSESIENPRPVARDGDIVERGAPPLSAAEVRLYLRDSTLSFEGETRVWHTYLREDGSMTGVAIGKDDRSVERVNGRWEVQPDGLFCRTWENDWDGGTGCAEVYRFGDDYLFVHRTGAQGEETEYRRTRKPGNPANL